MKINLIEYFEEIVSTLPNKVAVIDGKREITFSELAKNAKLLAKAIISKTNTKNKPVAVFLPKSIEATIADLAISYSGNAYMNLDVKNPAERLNNIISLINPSAIISNSKYKGIIEPLLPNNVAIIDIDLDISNQNIEDKDFFINHISDLIDTDPYCIINTSGSTGTPKGVVLNHKSFIDFMAQTFDEYSFSENDTLASLSPIVFDIWSYEICLLVGVGATIVIVPDTYSAFPIKILQLMQEHKVTYIFWVPTIMVNIANMGLLQQVSLPSLRLCWFAGEVFPTKQFNIWRRSLPNTKFANFYGPIEITLDCVYYNIEREIEDNEPIPIGKPFRNTGILILDENNQNIVEPNKDGELCVRGTSLAMGYYNDHEKTSEVFIQNPLNNAYPEIIYRTGDIVFINDLGEIVFKGRKDSLIKHMGYRIELGEIEHVIVNTLKLARNACIVYNYQKKEITLFYENENEISPAEFRKALITVLPKYMTPSVFVHLTELQRNTNGKIDRLFYNKQVNE